MAQSFESVSEPIPISLVSGRYLLFDVNVVTYLRRTHHICGTLIGSIPQNPQQNIFHGLPMELMPEEAKLLVQKEVAYIVDDLAWHKQRYESMKGEDKQKYLQSLRSAGLKARKATQEQAKKNSEMALSRLATQKAKGKKESPAEGTPEPPDDKLPDTSFHDTSGAQEEDSIFGGEGSSPSRQGTAFASNKPYPVTPTTSYASPSLPQNPSPPPDPCVPLSYSLFAHLHSRGYYIMPGLRFGCNYNVYPGDPLRFHSHFLATSFEWDQEIPMLDLIGGGRLGTAVKKGFLIGGEDTEAETDGEWGDNVRTFCIEWGGM
ncbi:SEN34 subunit of tRNA-splicing endonuclease [Mollisia scopiformis]|uniref:tRNA-splicing endonuclease subunit Sen34 n=1 Tax=Mollisia scopiformis TaxID=149040 RepID=A0A132B4G2_MOLSC|nr:SEN34 subunit of tRNA-splicing endonuclease [Mollisia scopiformis]KUJ06899.1 SEN34 subunit of tRNA-splicing endonuclease [Mollisia scopiformis]